MSNSSLVAGDKVQINDLCITEMCGKCGLEGEHKGPFPDDGLPYDSNEFCFGCSRDQVLEFRNSTGIVEGITEFNNVPKNHPDYDPSINDPDLLDVRWMPENLRYAYYRKYLNKVK